MEFICSIVLALTVFGGVTWERVADSATYPPGVSPPYSINRVPFSVCEDQVFFTATYQDKTGLYAASSSALKTIANVDTPVPGHAETFHSAERTSCDGGRVMFVGRQTNAPIGSGASVYEVGEEGLTLFLEEGFVVDGHEVLSLNRVAVSTSGVALIAQLAPSSVGQGVLIKPFNEAPFVVADLTTVLPGQVDPATIFSQLVWSSEGLVFRARTNQNIGLYRWNPNTGLSVIVDNSWPAPGGGTFSTFGGVAGLNSETVFEAGFPGGFGLFSVSDGLIESFLIPGDSAGGGDFILAAGLPEGRGGLLSFTARSIEHPTDAIWSRTSSTGVRRHLGVGDTVEGRQVDLVLSAADEAKVALLVDSQSDPRLQVIYRGGPNALVDVPLTPPALMGLALGLAVLGYRLLRR